jgi:hypothetical protein
MDFDFVCEAMPVGLKELFHRLIQEFDWCFLWGRNRRRSYLLWFC